MTKNQNITLQAAILIVLASVLAITETSTDSIQQLVSTIVWLIAG